MGSLAASHQLRGTVKTHLMESLSHIDFSWRYSHHAWYPTLSSSGPISSHSPLPAPRLAPPCVRSSVRPSPFSSYLKKKAISGYYLTRLVNHPLILMCFWGLLLLFGSCWDDTLLKRCTDMHKMQCGAVHHAAAPRCPCVHWCATPYIALPPALKQQVLRDSSLSLCLKWTMSEVFPRHHHLQLAHVGFVRLCLRKEFSG